MTFLDILSKTEASADLTLCLAAVHLQTFWHRIKLHGEGTPRSIKELFDKHPEYKTTLDSLLKLARIMISTNVSRLTGERDLKTNEYAFNVEDVKIKASSTDKLNVLKMTNIPETEDFTATFRHLSIAELFAALSLVNLNGGDIEVLRQLAGGRQI